MKKNTDEWTYGMEEDRVGDILNSLNRMYKDTYMKSSWDNEQEWEVDEVVERVSRVPHDLLLRDVMYELHKQGDGLDTLMALKNDQLRDWWATELGKIKKAEARAAAREKAKILLSDEERKLLGMKF